MLHTKHIIFFFAVVVVYSVAFDWGDMAQALAGVARILQINGFALTLGCSSSCVEIAELPGPGRSINESPRDVEC